MRRSSVMAAVLLVGLLVLPSWASAQDRVLLLPDVADCTTNPKLTCDGVLALVDALTVAGYEVTEGPLEFHWDGTNPPLDDFDAVVHLNGATFHTPLPMEAQLALEAFVRNGGGYIGSQFNGFEAASGRLGGMPDLVLQLWPHPDNCNECNMTWSVVPGQETHPVLEAVPAAFTFYADGHDAGPVVEFAVDPSTVLMTSPNGGGAVIVREVGEGTVVSFSSATNTSTVLTLQDPVIQLLYTNAVSWRPAAQQPTIESLQRRVDDLVDSGVLNPIQEWILDSLLRWADRLLEGGRSRGAAVVLTWFARQVEWWIRTGELTEDEGRPLVDDAQAIVAVLTG